MTEPARTDKASSSRDSGGSSAFPRSATPQAPPATQISNMTWQRAASGGGEPLPPPLRRQGEASLGISLSQVRIFRDARASQAARDLHADAFTQGDNIVMRRGQNDLSSSAGRALVGHELVHVAQTRLHGLGARSVSHGKDPAEREADRLSSRIVSGDGPAPRALQRPSARIQRQETDGETADRGEGGTGDAVEVFGPSTFDGSTVDVEGMSHETLNAESLRVDEWLAHGDAPGSADFPQYQILRGRLRGERIYRVQLGHLWMNRALEASPERLYMIAPGTNGRMDIIDVDPAIAAGVPDETPVGPIMTEAQYRAYLTAHSIREVDEGTYQRDYAEQFESDGEGSASSGMLLPDLSSYGGMSGTGDAFDDDALGPADLGSGLAARLVTHGHLYRDPFDVRARSLFSSRLTSASGREILGWRGAMAEAGYGSRASGGFGLFLDDLNTRSWTERRGNSSILHQPAERNFPAFDLERVPGSRGVEILGVQRISVKTSFADTAGRYEYYRRGLEGMLDAGARPSSLRHYIANQPGSAGVAPGTPAYDAARSAVLDEAFLAVNADDVAGFRAELANTGVAPPGATGVDTPGRSWADRPAYRRLYDAVMRESPISVETTTGPRNFSTAADLDAAQSTMTPEAYDAARREVGRRAARRIISSGRTTAELTRLRDYRASAPGTMSEADINRTVTPESLGSVRSGPGWRGEAHAAGMSSLRGGGVGGVIAVVTTAGVMMFDEADHPDWERELATGGVHGFASAGLSSAAEHTTLSVGSRYIMSRGGVTWLSPRMLGRVAPGVGSAVGEFVSMAAFEDRPHSTAEYVGRGTRAAGIGIVSYEAGVAATAVTTSAIAVILGTAGTGAAAGSVVPGWGTAIGFIVGLGVGMATYYALDSTLPGGREDWDRASEGVPLMRSGLGDAFRTTLDRMAEEREDESRRAGTCTDCAGAASSVGPGTVPRSLGYTPSHPLGSRERSAMASWIDAAE